MHDDSRRSQRVHHSWSQYFDRNTEAPYIGFGFPLRPSQIERFTMVDRALVTSFLLLGALVNAPLANAQEEDAVDLFALELVAGDLSIAKRQMTVHDPNEDGYIDKEEQGTLQWRDYIDGYDLNNDGKLTHLELAVRQAKLRDEAGITQVDLDNIQIFLRRHDKNRNGQLDTDEIAKGWPTNPEDFDTDNDGIISSAEMARQFAFMRGLRREMGIESVDQTSAIRLVGRFDTDNDKQLDIDERAGARLPLSADRFDDDSDGLLSIMEVATMLSRHRRDLGLTVPDQKKLRSLMQRDLDGDGTITAKELEPYGDALSVQYAQFDDDKDGEITIKEMESHFAAVRKERGYGPEQFNVAVRLLQRHDTNRSKLIEASELHERASKGKLGRSILAEADLDKDDKISLDELSRYLVKHPQG